MCELHLHGEVYWQLNQQFPPWSPFLDVPRNVNEASHVFDRQRGEGVCRRCLQSFTCEATTAAVNIAVTIRSEDENQLQTAETRLGTAWRVPQIRYGSLSLARLCSAPQKSAWCAFLCALLRRILELILDILKLPQISLIVRHRCSTPARQFAVKLAAHCICAQQAGNIITWCLPPQAVMPVGEVPEEVLASYASLVTAFRQVPSPTHSACSSHLCPEHLSAQLVRQCSRHHQRFSTTTALPARLHSTIAPQEPLDFGSQHPAAMVPQVELANVRSFYKENQKSPFKAFPWKTGTMHFHYVPQVTLQCHSRMLSATACWHAAASVEHTQGAGCHERLPDEDAVGKCPWCLWNEAQHCQP